MKLALRAVAGLALMGALFWLVLRGHDPRAVGEALLRASVLGVIAGAILNFAHNIFRTWRWGALLEPSKQGVPFRPMFSAIVIGYLVSWVIPARLGEVVRPALLAAKERVPLGASLGSVVADRLLDGATLAVLFAVGAQFAVFSGQADALEAQIRTGAGILAVATVVLIALLVAASLRRRALSRLLERAPRPIGWMGNAFLSVASGSEALRSPRLLVRIVALGFAAWLTIGFGTWLGVRAAGAPVAYAQILVLLLPLAFGIALPTPGGAGGYHAAMTYGLTRLFGIDPEVAVGAGILMHLAIIVPVLLAGPLCLRLERVSWRDVLAAGRGVRGLGARAVPSPTEATT